MSHEIDVPNNKRQLVARCCWRWWSRRSAKRLASLESDSLAGAQCSTLAGPCGVTDMIAFCPPSSQLGRDRQGLGEWYIREEQCGSWEGFRGKMGRHERHATFCHPPQHIPTCVEQPTRLWHLTHSSRVSRSWTNMMSLNRRVIGLVRGKRLMQ